MVVSLHLDARKPAIIKSSEMEISIKNDKHQIFCEANGSPLPQAEWFKVS